MRHRHGLALLLLLAPGVCPAQEAPEQLLPASTQAYIRWDGVEAHRVAYQKTALGQMMQGDTGVFLTGLFEQLQGASGSVLMVQSLMTGAPPRQLAELQNQAKQAAQLPALVGKNGFILAAEIRSVEPPAGQVTLILPGAGKDPGPLFGALRLAAGLAKAPVKESKIQGRTVWSMEIEPVHLLWWVEGKHGVVAVSTDKPEAVVKATMPGNKDRLTANPLFQRVSRFKTFETSARAFVDVTAFVKLGSSRNKQAAKLLDDLGLNGLKSLVLYSGFDGRADRGLVEWDMPGPRKGLLALFGGKPFRLGDVPALPPDVVSWSMTNFDAAAFYDALVPAIEQIVGLFEPDAVPKIKEAIKEANEALGVDVRKDLLGALGAQLAQYSSPGDGLLTLGNTVLLKVKDPDKLLTTLEQIVKSLGTLAGKEARIKKRNYRGVDVRQVYVTQEGFIFVPSYAIVDGWLVLSFYPQPVQAHIARVKGQLAAWKPSPTVKTMLDTLPQEFVAISYSDPQPTVSFLMSLTPLIGGTVASLAPALNFDVANIPSTQEVTRHLFPNLSVSTDDGKILRQETRDSLAVPFDLSDVLYLYGLAGLAAVAGGL